MLGWLNINRESMLKKQKTRDSWRYYAFRFRQYCTGAVAASTGPRIRPSKQPVLWLSQRDRRDHENKKKLCSTTKPDNQFG